MKLFTYAAAVSAASAVLVGFAALASAATSVVSLSQSDTNIPCPLVSSFMKQGNANNAADVARLQKFLKDSENADVDVNGVYDQKTVAAVMAFQKKYANEILAPWGATKASGIVYITTAKMINKLACAEAMTLSDKELTVISNYQSGLAMASNHASLPQQNGQSLAEAEGPTVSYMSATGTSDDMQAAGPGMEAAVGNASIIDRFWFFLRNMF